MKTYTMPNIQQDRRLSGAQKWLLSAVFACMMVFVMAPGAQAEDDVTALGPKVGEVIPHKIDAPTQHGKVATFEELAGEKGLILLFVRSVDWCPYCKAQVEDWNNNRKLFEDLGYQLAVISYDSSEAAKKFADRKSIELSLLSDSNSEIIKGFGILNEQVPEDSNFYGIPHPFIYVVAPDKKITHRFTEQSYADRPAVKMVHDALKGAE